MKTRLTIQDIARLAGVSKSTVSRVLNQNEHVDAATREHVLQVINKHGYVPSPNATGLNGRSRLIGILLPMITWSAILKTIWGISDYISHHTPYEIILYSYTEGKNHNTIIDNILGTRLVAGLLSMITTSNQSPADLISLHQQGFPVVLVDPVGFRAELPWVGTDHRSGAYDATRHLLEQGHRRIAYIQGPLSYPCNLERYQGYCQAMHEVGYTPEPGLFRQGEFNVDSGVECGKSLLTQDKPPTAIFACNDDLAYGTLIAAGDLGIRVPEDISIVGFNDDTMLEASRSMLTTIHQPFDDMGRCAAEMLLSLIDPQYTLSGHWKQASTLLPVSSAPLQIQLPNHLIVRQTTGSIPLRASS